MPISINDLSPTQAGLRDRKKALYLATKVEAGHVFNGPDDEPIDITKFEDNQLFVHNGHHRIVAIVLAGRHQLEDGEFKITPWYYDQYREVNWEQNFITPFNPVTESKIADLSRFREAVAFVRERNGEAAAEDFIRKHGYLYLVPRRIEEFWELAALTHAGLSSEVADFRLHPTAPVEVIPTEPPGI